MVGIGTRLLYTRVSSMAGARPLPVNRKAWVICAVAVFFFSAAYLRDFPTTIMTRVVALPFVLAAATGIGWVLQFLAVYLSGVLMGRSMATQRFVFIAVLLAAGGFLGRNIILRQYDAVRLWVFAGRIADADRVLAIWQRSPVEISFGGDEVKGIVQAASSGISARMPDGQFMCIYDARATFYKGTNVLGHIDICNWLFHLDSGGPPFADGSGVLESSVYAPLRERLGEWHARQVE